MKRTKSETVVIDGMSENEVAKLLLKGLKKKNLVKTYQASYCKGKFAQHFTRDYLESRINEAVAVSIKALREYRVRQEIKEIAASEVVCPVEIERFQELKRQEVNFSTMKSKKFKTLGSLLGYAITSFKNLNNAVYVHYSRNKRQYDYQFSIDKNTSSNTDSNVLDFQAKRCLEHDNLHSNRAGDLVDRDELITNVSFETLEDWMRGDPISIAVMKAIVTEGLSKNEIKKELRISHKEYLRAIEVIKEACLKTSFVDFDIAA